MKIILLALICVSVIGCSQDTHTIIDKPPETQSPISTEEVIPPEPVPQTETEQSKPQRPDKPINCGRQLIVNPSFEEGSFVELGTQRMLTQEEVRGWSSTSGNIDIWGAGYNGSAAYHGIQLAQMNIQESAQLYQDIEVEGGQRVFWQWSHQGRTGYDSVSFSAGVPGEPLTLLIDVASPNRAWNVAYGSYEIPQGQTVTRFQWQMTKANQSDLGVGILFDGAYVCEFARSG